LNNNYLAILGITCNFHILINLSTNTHHAMSYGGILEISLKNVELDEESAAQYSDLNPDRYVSLKISDTGQGISTKEMEKGTGMGLSVVFAGQKSLERLGYQVEVNLNAVEALELFCANPDQFDLVITDMIIFLWHLIHYSNLMNS